MKFEFSIVMAVYNGSKWLSEAIDSVINQTINFENNIQLILVDDGSIDNSKQICQKYENHYPNNIKYFYKTNGGQASARNLGLKHVEGQYINFLDCDDKLELNACEEVEKFFDLYQEEIDIVSIPLIFFEAESGNHILNYKFKSSSIIDLLKEPTYIQLSAPSSFFKIEALKNMEFDERLITSEDALLINQILLNKCKIGYLNSTKYFYRKRADYSSTTNNFILRKEYYNDQINFFLKKIIKYSFQKLSYVPEFIQYLVMYTLQWIFEIPHIKEILSEEEIKELYQNLHEILQYINDDIVNNQKNIFDPLKVHILSLKYNGFNINIKDGQTILRTGKNPIDILGEKPFWIKIIEIKDNILYISGYLQTFFENNLTKIKAVRIVDGNEKEFIGKEVFYPSKNYFSLENSYLDKLFVDLKIPLIKDNVNKIQFKVSYDNEVNLEVNLPIEFTINSRLSRDSHYSRVSYNNNKIYHNQYLTKNITNSIVIEPYSFKKLLKLELMTDKNIINNKKSFYKDAVLLRIIYFLFSIIQKSRIWLIMDRQSSANDNAEYFFNYAVTQKDNIKKYFILNEDSSDFDRMKKEGNIVKFGSFKHKLLFLLADKIVSSHPDDEVVNPFWGDEIYLINGLLSSQYIFLQHGIINEDISSWLNKCDMNLTTFVCSAKKEYDSIFQYHYNYDKDTVKILGLPRYDYLNNNNIKKQILIMPSWRHSFVKMTDFEFKSTSYFKNFNKLINDERIIKFCENNDYTIIFKPHPQVERFIHLFDKNSNVIIDDNYSMNYIKLFNESKLLITDNSSVFYDFAYLKKPIIYYHFLHDVHKFENKKSEYDFENDGFGDVIIDYDDLILLIEDYIKNDCILKDKYKERIEDFYFYDDKNNCKRVYDSIMQLYGD